MAKTRFERDSKKDQENQDKHGVAFGVAQFAFADPKRVIAEDLSQKIFRIIQMRSGTFASALWNTASLQSGSCIATT